jgi:hypothetical protein
MFGPFLGIRNIVGKYLVKEKNMNTYQQAVKVLEEMAKGAKDPRSNEEYKRKCEEAIKAIKAVLPYW